MLITAYLSKRIEKIPPANISEDLSQFQNLGSFKINESSNSIQIYSSENEILFTTSKKYYSSNDIQINVSDFIYNTKEATYNIADTISWKSYVLNSVKEIKIIIKNSECRFPIFFSSKNDSIIFNNFHNGVFSLQFIENSHSLLNFLNNLNSNQMNINEEYTIPLDFLEDSMILFYFCPFFESEETNFEFNVKSSSVDSLSEQDESSTAKSILDIIIADPNIIIDKIDTFLSSESSIIEDIYLDPYSASVYYIKSPGKFKILFEQGIEYTNISVSQEFGFVFEKKNKIVSNLGEEDEDTEEVNIDKEGEKEYFIIVKNLLNEGQEFRIHVSKI